MRINSVRIHKRPVGQVCRSQSKDECQTVFSIRSKSNAVPGQTNESETYTLFSVTNENRDIRSKRIRKVFRLKPAWGYLLAAFDFEWTVRRAIVLMGVCPTSVIHARFKTKKYAGWLDYQHCWAEMVRRVRRESIPELDIIATDGQTRDVDAKSTSDSIVAAMKLRHKLVHGIDGTIRAINANVGFEILISASERVSRYVDEHAEKGMFERATRTIARCQHCSRVKRCPYQHERDPLRRKVKGKRK